jgi:pimeloyl-ACP methyl ester carboxylesterase
VLGPPLGGEALVRAEAAVAAGKPGLAMQIFIRDIVKMPAWMGLLVRVAATVVPTFRAFVPRQIRDCRALDNLGLRLDAYAGIEAPVVLLGGDRSPPHLGERLDALASKLPRPERVVMRGQGHGANDDAPGEVARVIEALADRVLPV